VTEAFFNLYCIACISMALATGFIFLFAFARRRHPASLVVCWAFTVVPVWIARERHWLPVSFAKPLLVLAGPILLLGLLIVLNAEQQR
jgi:hypothetical protein